MATGGGRVFTQQELNSIVAQERRDAAARYAGFDDFKAKAEQFDLLVATANGDDGAADGGAAPNAPDAPDVPDAPDGPDAPAVAAQAAVQVENQELHTRLLRQQISAQRGLDPDLWDRVIGDTPDEIAADVGKLVGKFGAVTARAPRGYQSGASAPDWRSPKEKAAAALRGMNRGA